jgi:alanine dehydrogenase
MMRVGIPKEIKIAERRVSLTPNAVRCLTSKNIRVNVESNAGKSASFTDEAYIAAGASILPTTKDLFQVSDLIVKVKEPQSSEYSLIGNDHTVFSFFHFEGSHELLAAMKKSGAKCLAFETVQTAHNTFPILTPMSEIAGEEAILQGVHWLSCPIEDANISIIGAGNAGIAAAKVAKQLGCKNVTLLDINENRLTTLKNLGYQTMIANRQNLTEILCDTHLAIGAVYQPGKCAPKIISKEMLLCMPNNALFVDISIDQGGMTEVSTPTNAYEPLIRFHHVNLFCVDNIPGRVQFKASLRLSDAVISYVELLALQGYDNAINNSYELNKSALHYKECLSR